MDKEKVIAWLAEEELYYREKQDATKDDLHNSKMAFYALTMLKEQPEIVRCKDCKYAILTYSGECKYCKKRIDDNGGMDKLYLPGDWYCADGERKKQEDSKV